MRIGNVYFMRVTSSVLWPNYLMRNNFVLFVKNVMATDLSSPNGMGGSSLSPSELNRMTGDPIVLLDVDMR